MDANIKLRGMSGFAFGRRIKVFCVPEDVTKFRGFLKSAKIRAREGDGFSITGENKVGRAMAVLDKIALSGFDIKAFDAFGTASL